MAVHKVVSHDEWVAARKKHLAKEKEFTPEEMQAGKAEYNFQVIPLSITRFSSWRGGRGVNQVDVRRRKSHDATGIAITRMPTLHAIESVA